MIRVWDALVRSLHWLLAASVCVAWISGHWASRWFEDVHHTAGHVAAAVVAVRVVWGMVGGRYARFRQFVRGPRAVWSYARLLRAGRERRYVGHNPLGGWMVVALLAAVAAVSLTGYLAITDWLWGFAWVTDLHAALAWLMVLLVPAHVGGVVLTSIRHRENLVTAMCVGDKREPSGTDLADARSEPPPRRT